jgi:dipeptidyl aminopeptidase/acylaminoacyl peptidase
MLDNMKDIQKLNKPLLGFTMFPFFIGCLVALMAMGVATAASVQINKGDVYYVADNGKVRQLTTSGVDRSPQLSPDGKTIVFVRSEFDVSAPDYIPSNIWSMDTSGNNQRVLVNAHAASIPEDNLSGLDMPTFAPDGKLIYFISAAWTTSGAVHVLDVRIGKTWFLSPGNTLKMVPWGKYAGNLIVSKHKYFAGGGAYDFYWLISPTGEEIMPIGDTEEQIDKFLRSEKS